MKKSLWAAGILLTTTLFWFFSCSSSRQVENGVVRLNNAQFKKEVAKSNTVLIDVRTPEEYKAGHIEGSLLMNYEDTENFTRQIQSLDPSKHYILYCRSGRRSMNAAYIMISKGIKKISDLKNGISQWDGPVVTDK